MEDEGLVGTIRVLKRNGWKSHETNAVIENLAQDISAKLAKLRELELWVANHE